VVALTGRYNLHTGRFDEAEANAAFIVRACNAHEELVEALKAALSAETCPCCYRDNTGEGGCTSDDCPGVQAVARAEGR